MRNSVAAVQILHDALIRRPEGFIQFVVALRHPLIHQGHFADKIDPAASGSATLRFCLLHLFECVKPSICNSSCFK